MKKACPFFHQLCYLERVKSPVVCFCASHRAIHKGDLTNLDVEYRRLLCMVVGLTAILAYKSHSHAPIATKQTESQPYDPFHPTPLCPCASHDITSSQATSHMTAHHISSHVHAMTLHHITSHHITSHHITSHHDTA